VERAPPSEGGRRTFESCRRGRANPALGAAHGRDPAGSGARLLTGYGVTPVRVRVSPLPPLPRKRPGWMRSLSRKQVRVSRPLGVRVAPLPLSPRSSSGHDAGFSSRKPGFDSPSRYAIDCQVVQWHGQPAVTRRTKVRPLPWQRHARWLAPEARTSGHRPERLFEAGVFRGSGRGFRRAAANRDTQVRVLPGRPSRGRRSTDKDPGTPRRR
jgi:hypothetical protein